MPILNFTMFVDKVISGEKRQTIRKLRKRPFKVGDKLYLYAGLRTKEALNLVWEGKLNLKFDDNFLGYPPYVICKEVQDIEIFEKINLANDGTLNYSKSLEILVDGVPVAVEEKDKFIQTDGFTDIWDFWIFFKKTHGFPFKGQLIKW